MDDAVGKLGDQMGLAIRRAAVALVQDGDLAAALAELEAPETLRATREWDRLRGA